MTTAAGTMKPMPATDDDRRPFMAFVTDEISRRVLVNLGREADWNERDVHLGGLDEMLNALNRIPTPRRLLADLSESQAPLDDVIRLAGVCDPGTHVIAIGTVNDVELFRKLIGCGVADYLVKPVSAEALRQAIAASEPVAPAQPRSCQLVAMIGSRGGVGTTMIATGVAWLLAHEAEKRVALVDLDPFFGNTALSLNLEPGHGLTEAFGNPSRIDDLFIARAMVREHDRLFILAAEENLQTELSVQQAAIESLFAKLRQNFDLLIVDLPRGAMEVNKTVMDMADRIVAISDLSIAGIRDTLRLGELARAIAPRAEFSVVANRVVRGGRGDIGRADFERTIGRKIDCLIPLDRKAVDAAIDSGAPLAAAAGRSPVVQALRNYCGTLAGAEQPARKRSFWNRFRR